MWAHPRLSHYNRLVAATLCGNALFAGVEQTHGSLSMRAAALAATVNFVVAVVARQQHLINLLFTVVANVPPSWPLRVRRSLGKIYHFGGLHAGTAVSGTVWSIGWAAAAAAHSHREGLAEVAVSVGVAGTAVAMSAGAVPALRARFHDLFEFTHRFGGWVLLLLLWIHLLLRPTWLGAVLLTVATASAATPWLRLRKVAVAIERPSPHVAFAHLDYGVTPGVGYTMAVSRKPLTEWHSFATMPRGTGAGYRLAVSRAGDWTGSFIDQVPYELWVKGIPTAGIGRIERMFARVVYLVTGSGIGPSIPHILAAEVPAQLVWVARDPRTTYGELFLKMLLKAHPHAIIWDTARDGKPDAVRLAYTAYRSYNAEAVICVSNKSFTWQVVHGLESRGIPAYGPIWDS
jgi:hypothetical protein